MDITCRTCDQLKSEDQFNRSSKAKNGRQSECRACACQRNKQRYHSLSKEQKKELAVRQTKHRRENLEMYRVHKRKWLYNITDEEFHGMLMSQDHKCAICKTEEPGGRYKQWVIDHDHRCCSGERSCGDCIRGVLCGACNHGLGSFRDDITALRSAIEYLASS